jgi:hypothetical protein
MRHPRRQARLQGPSARWLAALEKDARGCLERTAECDQLSCLPEVHLGVVCHQRGACRVEAETRELIQSPDARAKLPGLAWLDLGLDLLGLVHVSASSCYLQDLSFCADPELRAHQAPGACRLQTHSAPNLGFRADHEESTHDTDRFLGPEEIPAKLFGARLRPYHPYCAPDRLGSMRLSKPSPELSFELRESTVPERAHLRAAISAVAPMRTVDG